MRLKSFLLSFLLTAVFATTCWAQTHEITLKDYPTPTYNQYIDNDKGITLEVLIEKAKGSNKELQVAQQNLSIMQGRIVQAGLKPNPTLDTEFGSDKLTGTGKGEYDFSVSYSQPIEIGGKRAKRIRISQLELAQAEKMVAFQTQQLQASIYQQYAQAVTALESLRISESLTALNEEITKLVKAKFKEGDAAKLDLNLVLVELNRLRASQLQAEVRVKTALITLKTLAGLRIDEPLRLRASLNLPTLTNLNLADLEQLALKTRADLQSARLEEELAQARIELAQAEAKPDLAIFGRYQQSRTIFDKTAIGTLRDTGYKIALGVSIPLAIFNRNQGVIAETSATKVQATQRRELVEQNIRRDVTLAYTKLALAQESIKLYEEEILPGAQENLKIIRTAYDLGEQQLLDFIGEQRRLIESQQQYAEIRRDYYTATIELTQALGQIVP